MNNDNLDVLKELEYDYEKYILYYNQAFKQWKEEGIFHRRLTFEDDDGKEINCYVTTAKVDIDYSFSNNDFIIPYFDRGVWDVKNKRRVQELMKMNIGHESPRYGELICYGNFEPQNDDLTNVRYKCIYGKHEFKSAKDTLSNHGETYTEKLIDIDRFFRLKFELADIGEQSKALYDEDNAIIDGSAGTGKSTIALQKLKYLSVNKNISQGEILIIVKNNHLKIDFKSLLDDENLKLNDIEIKTVDELNANVKSYSLNFLQKSKQQSIEIRKVFDSFILKRNAICITEHYESLLIFFHNKNLLNKEKKYSLDNIKEWQDKYTNSVYKNYFLALEYLHRYKNYYDDIYRTENKKLTIAKKIQKLEQKLNNENLTDKEYKTYEKLEIELNKLEKKEIEEYSPSREQNIILKEILKKLYFNKTYIDNYLSFMSNDEKELIIKYLDLGEYEYDTILIDEAQDYSLVELEVLRLYAKRVILTGDILQNLDNGEISDWSDILNVNEIYSIEDKNGEDRLNIFTLKHNFRQTYQLANASYNFRQLLLDKESELEDIKSEYYLSEKEFNGKPYQLPTIIFKQNIKKYISEKIKHIKNTFTSQIPIVLVYKTNEEKESYQQELKDYRLSYDTEKIENIDVILVDILEAKGKQFPVVVSSLDGLRDREIYLIMTRGQFEVEFLSSTREVNNNYLKILKEKEWVETKGVTFISEKTPKKFVNSGKDEEFISKDSSQSSKPNEDEVFKKEESLNSNKTSIGEEKIKLKLKEQIPKHKKETTQYDEELDPDIITDEEGYKQNYIEKIKEDIKEFDNAKQNEIIKEIIVVRKKSTDKKTKELREGIKNYLMNTYKGYCQICGFSFRKIVDGKNSFEMFNWNDKRIVKQKKSFITNADSLCLCRNCSANIKWGDFDPIFIDKINDIDGFAHKSVNEIKDLICVKLEDEVIDRFKKYYEWEDIYALEIKVNGEPKNIYMTNGHLIQFIAYLQLEEKINEN